MSSHNLHNTTITQHMSVLGGGAGCWFTAAPPHQLPPTAPLRQKRHPSASNHQPLSVHHVMHSQQQMSQQQQQLAATTFTPISPPNTFAPISPPGGFTPLSCPQQPLPLSPKTPNGPQHQMMGHMNHHNPHAAMSHSVGVSLHSGQPNNMAMSVQSGLLLAQQPPGGANGSMATSLQTMSGMLQQQSHNISMLQAHHQQLHSTNANVNATHHLNPVIHQQQLQQSSAGIPDINSIQHGLPQALRGAKSLELRPCNMPWHHGKITRERAEQLLQPRTDGLFLVRESTNFPGDQTLCVCFQNRVEHYRIKCGAQSTLTIDDEEFFETLPLLIDHYLQDADGLCTQLVKCLPKQQPPLMTSTQMVPAVASIPPIQQSNQQITNQQTANQQMGNQQLPNQQTINQQAQPPPQSIQQQKLQQQSQQNHQQGGQPAQLNQPQSTTAAEHNVAPCLAPQAFVDAGWMISERDLEIRENIGKGEFGDVMLGILNGQRVAVKMLKDSEAASKFLAEASLMTSLKHENLVKLLGLVFNKQHICLVTEYMSKGSLVDYLRSRGRLHVTKRDQIMFAFDTCSGMEYLEARRVVHRDLAARNVLVSDTRRAKVADFGLAREEGGPDAAAKLPIKWTAPEALKHNKFSNKSDMWSFGILLWEIYSFGRVPYPRIPLADVVKHVEKGYKMEAPESCPPEVYDLMRQAWDLNPDTRPTFSQLKSKLAQLKANTPLQ